MRFLIALLLAMMAIPATAAAPDAAVDTPEAAQDADRVGDVALYADVAAEVRDGATYYDAVTRLHRERGYPLRPVATIRPPALAYISAALGERGLKVLAWALLLTAIAMWYRTLKAGSMWERIAVAALLAMGGGAVIGPAAVQIHEFWAGMLITIALGMRWAPRAQVALATLAALIRELSLPLFGLLLYPFSRRRAVSVAIALVVVAIYYAGHFFAVENALLPSDRPSPGWFGMRGLAGFTDHLSTIFGVSVPLWLSILPLVGWGWYARRDPVPLLWCTGVIGAVSLIARSDNLFWVVMMFPLYFAGLAFLGTMLADAVKYLRGYSNPSARVDRKAK